MKSFKQYTEEKKKSMTFAFGRFNPPTIGHLKLLDKVKKVAKTGDYEIYASQSNDPKKNPLTHKDKIKYMKKMFPKHAKHISDDLKMKTAFHIMPELYKRGYTEVNFVVGSDRVPEFENLKKYDGVEDNRLGFYTFPDGINIVSAGERDPDSKDIVSAMSASRLRAAASEGNFKEFELGMPKGFKDAQGLFNAIRKGMNLKPIKNFREHIKLPEVSDIREMYIKNEIFNVGDKACYIKENTVITITKRKTNYVVDENENKYFLIDLLPINE